MKKAITVYIDDDRKVEGASIVLCTVSETNKNDHCTGMFNSDMSKANAVYFPKLGDIKQFWEEK